MKTWMWIVLGVVVLMIVVILIARSNKAKQLAQEKEQFENQQYSQATLPQGGTSTVAQVISSLYPFWQDTIQSGAILGNN